MITLWVDTDTGTWGVHNRNLRAVNVLAAEESFIEAWAEMTDAQRIEYALKHGSPFYA